MRIRHTERAPPSPPALQRGRSPHKKSTPRREIRQSTRQPAVRVERTQKTAGTKKRANSKRKSRGPNGQESTAYKTEPSSVIDPSHESIKPRDQEVGTNHILRQTPDPRQTTPAQRKIGNPKGARADGYYNGYPSTSRAPGMRRSSATNALQPLAAKAFVLPPFREDRSGFG